MDTQQLEKILTSDFDLGNFIELLRSVFKKIDFVAPEFLNKNCGNFFSHMAGYYHIGNFKNSQGEKILLCAIQQKKASNVENARSVQRGFVKKLIENVGVNAGFVAFYTPNDPKWRISFIKLDYDLQFDNFKVKTSLKITPAKRYSYLVGREEPSHTAVERLKQLISKQDLLTLENLEEAFSVEKVTDEFFDLYCEKFHQIREYLDRNTDFIKEAKLHNFTSVQFAKKLMGQIVFLYFLQKKGWLGVNAWPKTLNKKKFTEAFYKYGKKSQELIPLVYSKNSDNEYVLSGSALDKLNDEDERILAECVTGSPWGTGEKKFMRKLFEYAVKKEKNYFDDFLEPLFYNALNVNRGEHSYCSDLHCRIPFLSGGLFEPIDGYDWKHNNFSIPNEIFSNNDEKNPGVLDIFDRYNFTMSEDEPMEQEVAIDPEMLGKVFENLLEITDRKSKGAFYTPREIVHYMCQESLVHYLSNTLEMDVDNIREFVLYGEYIKDYDMEKSVRTGFSEMRISEQLFKVDNTGKVVVNKLKEMDNALKNVRIADPAVGSGAFPLGMINEIVRLRNVITSYLIIEMKSNGVKEDIIRLFKSIDRLPYALKKETIKNCIYGVDIEPSAVDIAQLRLWLSLVIEDEITPNADDEDSRTGHKNPLPLPNLECNILCGNSLLDEFKGYKLINANQMIGTDIVGTQYDADTNDFGRYIPKLIEKQNELFECDNPDKKLKIKKEIADIRDIILSVQTKYMKKEDLEEYNKTKIMASKPYVLWQLDFARVFSEKGGFDIVIGNPPYIDSETMTNIGLGWERDFLTKKFENLSGNWDMYMAFFEKGLSMSRILTYITPDKWLSKPFGLDFRKNHMMNRMISICHCGNKVFNTATVDSIVSIFDENNKGTFCTFKCISKTNFNKISQVLSENVPSPFYIDSYFSPNGFITRKMDTNKNTLKNIALCENACATSDFYKVKELIEEKNDPNVNVYYKLVNTGTLGKYCNFWKNKQISYGGKYSYPVVKRDLFERELGESYVRRANSSKLIFKGLNLLDVFLDEKGEYLPGKSTMVICSQNLKILKFLLGVLNSSLSIFYIKTKYASSSYCGGMNFSKDMFNEFPIPELDEEKMNNIVVIVDEILRKKQLNFDENILYFQKKIDKQLFKLYNLSYEEVLIVDKNFEMSRDEYDKYQL